jgi:hypothetical protein
MSEERPFFRLYVHGYLNSEHGPLQALILRWFPADPADPVWMDRSYSIPEIPHRRISELVIELACYAPGTSWEMWTDPVGGELGEYRAYDPELGSFGPADCSAAGDVLIDLDKVNGLQKELRGRRSMYEAVFRALAGPWKNKWEGNRS